LPYGSQSVKFIRKVGASELAYVRFEEVCKYYHVGETAITAADHMNFTIEKGEFCVIVGPSGAGKTTLLNMLGGMDSCDSGIITLDDREISALSERQLTDYRRHEVGFVFQFYNLIPNLTALENVELASEICLNPREPEETLRAVGLAERMDNFPAQLSGGEQQRVSIARALAKNPKILLCDEPTGALDYATGKLILKLLLDSCRETGKTVILITHNHAVASMADRVIQVKNGRILTNETNSQPLGVEQIEW
jgi:putative ABC transport system ATP-binding protein